MAEPGVTHYNEKFPGCKKRKGRCATPMKSINDIPEFSFTSSGTFYHTLY